MRKLEIKKIGTGSFVKTTIYFMLIPSAIIFLIGLLATIIAAIFVAKEFLIFGIMYMLMPVFMLVIYGLISALIALVYSGLARKFGGLEIYVEEDQDL